MKKHPLILQYKEIEKLDGKTVRLKGVYKEYDIRMRQENPANLFEGHVAIYLEDDWPVLLYPIEAPKSIRPDKERKELNGKKVIVLGEIFQYAPSEDESVAKLMIPCISNIQYIEAVSD